MRKLLVLVMVMAVILVVGVVAFQAIPATSNDTNTGVNDTQQIQGTPEISAEPTAEPTAVPTVEPTVVPTAEPVVEPTAELVYDQNGKAYFVGDPYEAFNLAIDYDIQERLDLAEIVNFRVYDIQLEGDLPLVDEDGGKEVNLVYGIAAEELPEEVIILRDGYAVFTWDEENFGLSEKEDKVFQGASDAQFTDKVYCAEHKAINSRVLTGYPNSLEWAEGSRKGARGPFDLEKLDHQLFEAWILVARKVELEGEIFEAYTWVVRTCGCIEGTVSVPTKAPTVKPTQAPTVAPTQAPTQAPTVAPTQAPTVKPTQVPTQEPTVKPTQVPTQEPTVKPTQDPTQVPTVKPTPSFNPEPSADPTQKPTVAPTPSFNPEPSADPTQKPTVAPTPTFNFEPEADPTQKPTAVPVPTFNVEPEADPTATSTVAPTKAPTVPEFNFEPVTDPTTKPTTVTSSNSDAEGNFSDEPNEDPVVEEESTSSGPSFSF